MAPEEDYIFVPYCELLAAVQRTRKVQRLDSKYEAVFSFARWKLLGWNLVDPSVAGLQGLDSLCRGPIGSTLSE